MRFHEVGPNEIWRKQGLYTEVMWALSDARVKLFQSSALSAMLCSYKPGLEPRKWAEQLKALAASARGPACGPQHSCDSSQASVTPVSGDQSPSSDLCRKSMHSCIRCRHACTTPIPTTPPHRRTQEVTSHSVTLQLLLRSC